MAYIRFKEVTRSFNFTKSIDMDKIPQYGNDYVYDGEEILAAYVVGRDISLITTDKILLFDNSKSLGITKEITTIPFDSITSHSILFSPKSAEMRFLLETSNPLILKFSNIDDTGKYKLRLIYNAMSIAILGKKVPKTLIDKIHSDKDNFKKK